MIVLPFQREKWNPSGVMNANDSNGFARAAHVLFIILRTGTARSISYEQTLPINRIWRRYLPGVCPCRIAKARVNIGLTRKKLR